ncbi:MAG: ATP-dependent DNA helicase RecG [Clostridia bacterium]|nr:ATP-dependent DNA helicase RecG [Clostridia bacterium]
MWNTAVKFVKGIGERRAALLQKLNIYTAGDLVCHFPRRYEDRRQVKYCQDCQPDERACLAGQVLSWETARIRPKLLLTKARLSDPSGTFTAIWFNQSHLKLEAGQIWLLTGKIKIFQQQIQLQVDEAETMEPNQNTLHLGRIVPVYEITSGLSQKIFRQAVWESLQKWSGNLSEFLPQTLMQKYKLPTWTEALWEVHFPSEIARRQAARQRLVFEEMLLHQLLMLWQRKSLVSQVKPHRYGATEKTEENFLASLPFELTLSQQQVWADIKQDLRQNYPMYRLLQGDVGSGKTIISFLALQKAAASGLQGALMVPTEILAQQHFELLQKMLPEVKSALLTGSLSPKAKAALLQAIAQQEVQLVIGTHALIQESVNFPKLALVIIDEQHRFGVRQRALLQLKGCRPDVLIMTATPIPRTLALSLYGDLEVSSITELPPGRQPVQTYWYKHSQWPIICQKIRQIVQAGQQVYLICPLVAESEKIDLDSAQAFYQQCSQVDFPDLQIGLLHGRLKSEEKKAVIEAFQNGQIQILVGTTVVEVGINVIKANLMVIMDAHRFGLAQLHQLRGRVGRGDQPAFCCLVSDHSSREVKGRLEALCQASDGFSLAEKDLEFRGPGEFWGTRQSGLPAYKIANPFVHLRALELARQEAKSLLQDDPNLTRPENQALAKELQRRFGKLLISGFA